MSAKAEHYDVIRKPVITEKATMASEQNAVVFEVAIDANKPMICAATHVVECVRNGECTSATPDVYNLPVLLRIDLSS